MLSIITVNYRNFEALKACWKSLQAQDFQDFEWIIIDNNSPKDEGRSVAEYFENVSNIFVITLNENIGFGAASDEGVLFAKGEILVLMNPDIEVTDGCFSALKETLESKKNIGIVVPKLLGANKKYQGNGRTFPTILELFGRRLVLNNTQDEIQEKNMFPIDWAQGSFLMMSKKFFEKLGGFDNRFFLFMEDTDLCRRCWELEKSVILNPKATAIHGAQRLSGGHVLTAIFKKTFWIHLSSMVKYFQKYKGKSNPRKS